MNCDGSKLQQGLLTSLKSMLCVGNSHVNKVLRGIGNSNKFLSGKKSHAESVLYNNNVHITQGSSVSKRQASDKGDLFWALIC